MKYILVLIFPFFSLVSRAQVDIINESLTDNSLNILYIGVDNQIKVKKNIPEYVIVIKGSGGIMTKLSQDQYLVRVSKIDSCKIIISRNGKQVLARTYKIDTVPHPIATISGLRDTTIKLNRVLLNPSVTVILPGCYIRNRLQATSFLATVIRGTDSIIINNWSNSFSEELIKEIKQLERGNEIYFDGIRAIGPDDRTRKLTPFWLKIE